MIGLAALLALVSHLSGCGGADNGEASQRVESDSDVAAPAPPSTVEPEPEPAPEPEPVQCQADDPTGAEVVLLTGQSNANTGLAGALSRTLTGQGINNWLGHYYIGGNPIDQWIDENGNLGRTWAPMIRTFDRAILQASTSGAPLNGLTIVWFQGESDVYPNTYPLYGARLRQLINAFESHAEKNWPTIPEPAFALALPEFKDPKWSTGLEAVRGAISSIANESANVCAFETRDINRIDVVHIPNYPRAGSPEQFVVAERALACGRIAANRCERSTPSE